MGHSKRARSHQAPKEQTWVFDVTTTAPLRESECGRNFFLCSVLSPSLRDGMVRFAQVVLGPAGSGKSTYCAELQKHCNDKRRAVHVVNLDPVSFFC